MTGSCSIVIRAYNEEKHIGRLLEGIKQQTVKDVDVILVDSGSTDSTVSIAESFGARVVNIRPEEFTFGRSLNLGVKEAKRSASSLSLPARMSIPCIPIGWRLCCIHFKMTGSH